MRTTSTNYEKIIHDNLHKIYDRRPENLEQALPAVRNVETFVFTAFGEPCRLQPHEVTFSGRPDRGPRGLLISLYAARANPEPAKLEPFKSFKDFHGSMPYHGAFTANSETVLVPYVPRIRVSLDLISTPFKGEKHPSGAAGDFSLLLYPLPKIALCYIFYLADEDFPASVTCLFSANALSFMPLDGLADVAEYTSKRIIVLLERGP